MFNYSSSCLQIAMVIQVINNQVGTGTPLASEPMENHEPVISLLVHDGHEALTEINRLHFARKDEVSSFTLVYSSNNGKSLFDSPSVVISTENYAANQDPNQYPKVMTIECDLDQGPKAMFIDAGSFLGEFSLNSIPAWKFRLSTDPVSAPATTGDATPPLEILEEGESFRVWIFQFSTIPDHSPITSVPLEILDMILMEVAKESHAADCKCCAKVCRLWNARVRNFDPEPFSAFEKLKHKREHEGRRRLWHRLDFKFDQDRGVSLQRLFREVREYSRSPNDDSLLDHLAEFGTIERLTLKQWPQLRVHIFLAKTQSWRRLYHLEISYSGGEGCEVLDAVYEAECEPKVFINLRTLELYNFAITPRLGQKFNSSLLETVKLHSCFPFNFHIHQQRTPMNQLDLTFKPLKWFKGLPYKQFRFDRQLDMSHFGSITRLTIDGGHENSSLLPRDFFMQKELRNLINLTIHYCSVGVVGFTTLAKHLLERNKYINIALFFRQWDEDELRLARMPGVRLTEGMT
ncbi:hypothetical protein BT69DRAFT_1298399 [Atractiella rhizophila]|nr:hypothetical protein BT69DRAFT_1298399 [Atractiella rhizophila]